MAECLLGKVMVVEPGIAQERGFQVFGTFESMGGQNVGDSAIEPLHHAIKVCGERGWVKRCSIPSAWQSWSNSCWPLACLSLAPNRRSVNSLPLSVSSLAIRIGQTLCKAARKLLAAAVLWRWRLRSPAAAGTPTDSPAPRVIEGEFRREPDRPPR